jgi:tetratricopeptide (TPR) repeat protein
VNLRAPLRRVWCWAIVLLILCNSNVLLTHASTQDQLERVKRLYYDAAYEDALAELDRPQELAPEASAERAEYRILCLLALGREESAQRELEKLVRADPLYRPNVARVSPRLKVQFQAVSKRVLPDVITATYADAKAALARKDYKEALAKFDFVLELLLEIDESELRDVRRLASQFRDLAKLAGEADPPGVGAVGTTGRAAQEPVPTGASSSADIQPRGSGEAPVSMVYDASSADVVPPTALTPIVPPLSPDANVAHKTGLFELLIDEHGIVVSSSVRRSIGAQHDGAVLNESRNWRFKPATLNGHPVRYKKLVEIYVSRAPRGQR